jgi:AcrR family transcriptional regulator
MTGSRAPGRPRSESARLEILAATFALAQERGPRGVSMEAIAKRAGVSKETLYRWWHSKTEVILETLVERGQQTIAIPDSGNLASDLRAFLRATARALDPTMRQLLRALAAEAAADQQMADLVRGRFLAMRRAALGELLARAVARGELDGDSVALTVDMVYGSLWYRLVFGGNALDRAWADGLAAAIAPGKLSATPTGRRRQRARSRSA